MGCDLGRNPKFAKRADEPVALQTVIDAIYAVDREAAWRGEMFPQTSDEQREDRSATARVTGMLMWYEKNTGCSRIKGWPVIAAAPAAPAYVPLSNDDLAEVVVQEQFLLVCDGMDEFKEIARAIESLVVARMRGVG
jgi:hypothetical protein